MKYLQTKIVLFALIALFSLEVFAQDDEQLTIEATVLNSDAKPIEGAIIKDQRDNTLAISDDFGFFTTTVDQDSYVNIAASGYKSYTVKVDDEDLGDIILQEGSDDEVQIAFRKVDKENIIAGGVSYVDVPEILEKNYTTYSLDGLNAFVGGFNGGNIWGTSNYLVLVDGVPRSAQSPLPIEIDQVTFLKGVSAVALYGSRAAQGVVLITTKRGEIGDQKIDVRVNAGLFVPKRYAEYLGSAEYMTYYNEARANDGIDPLFTEETIFNHASGSNPYRYPNVNYYSDEYLKKVYQRYDATLQISGGNERARYYTDVGFFRTGDLVDFGQAQNNKTERFNIRGNVDLKINDWIKASIGTNATYYNGRGVNTDYWASAANTRPNRFTPFVPINFIDPGNESAQILIDNSSTIVDDQFLLGGTPLDQTNSFAAIYAGGYNTFTSREFQFNTSVDADLGGFLKGLTFNTMFGVDYSTSYNQSFNNEYAVYQPFWNNVNGEDVIERIDRLGADASNGIQNISGSSYQQTVSFSGQFNYKTSFDEDQHFSAMLIAGGWQQLQSGVYHRLSSANLGLQLAYDYKEKYYVLFNEAAVHSARFAKGQRTGYSPTATLAWKIGKEDFLSDSSIVNDLQLSVSAGVLSTDLGIDNIQGAGDNPYFLSQGVYNQSNGNYYSWRDGALIRTTNSLQGENLDLTFARRKEINVELKGSLFNNTIDFQTAFFSNRVKGNIIQASVLYPSYFTNGFPQSSFIPYINYNNDDRIGLDFDVTYNKNFGDFELAVGVAGLYYDTKAAQRADLYYIIDYQFRQGLPLDARFGLQSDGFFENETDIENSPNQSALAGGNVAPGDIKYIDQNGDGVINDQDQVYLGKAGFNGPPLSGGLHITAKWKDLTFFALATGQTGAYGIKDSPYFWIDGEDKYSAAVRDRWTPATASTATYPRLTSQSGANNFRSSDFWMYSTDRIDLAKIQVSYDLPKAILGNSLFKSLNIYVSGSNLLTISSEVELMELNIGGAPQTRFYNLGVRALF